MIFFFFFLPDWNGRESILPLSITSEALHLSTDASNLGMGGVYGKKWFFSEWDSMLRGKHINVKELFAIFAAVVTWGDDMDVIIYTDNKPITQIWLTGSTKNKKLRYHEDN